MTCIDFNLIVYDNGSESLLGANHVSRSNCVFADHGLLSAAAFQVLRHSLSRRSSYQKLYLSRSVLLPDFCPTDRPRKSTRYRSLSACRRPQTLSCGDESPRITHDFSQSQRSSRLANLSRPGSDADRPSTPALCSSAAGHESQASRLRAGLHRRRSVFDTVSMGSASATQERRQGPYTTRPAGQYSDVYPHYRRPDARCEFSRPRDLRGRSILYHGQGLHRFSTSVLHSSAAIVLCHTCQKQHGLHPTGILSGGQKPRPAKRPDHSIDRAEKFGLLSRTASANPLCRYRTGQTFPVSDQQFQSVTVDDCTAVQVSLADRTVLQMDQAASSDQSLLRHHTQRRQDAGVDRHQRLCTGRYPEKGTQLGSQHVRNAAGFGCHAFRENTHQKPVLCGFQQLFKERYT